MTGNTVTKQFYDQGEQINGANYYYTKDKIGSIRELIDSNGNVQANYDYDSWGRQTVLNQTVTADFGYTGFYINKSTGFDLTWYRVFDPEKGRWLSRDPINNIFRTGYGTNVPGGDELYSYVNNNPWKFKDSLGLLRMDVCDEQYQKDCQKCYSDEIEEFGHLLHICLLVDKGGGEAESPLCPIIAGLVAKKSYDKCMQNADNLYKKCLKDKPCNKPPKWTNAPIS